jgi:hypothetical protein
MEPRRNGYQPDHSGLQVVEHHDGHNAPEVDLSHSLPQVVPGKHQTGAYAQAPLIAYKDADIAPELAHQNEANKIAVNRAQPWWKLKRWIIAIVVIILIIVGAIVGAVVATR